uniref:Conotoxin superfamily F n=1 Tax=Conus magus TaxID=6492 RepID=A0A5P8I0F3_CONMA|nr:conotoxin superfamily F [Conus magus]
MMQRGAVLLGVVAFLALWPQAAAKVYNLHDTEVWAVVAYSKRVMHACAIANSHMDDPWLVVDVKDFEERSLFHSMYKAMVSCLEDFFQQRP